MCPKDSEGKSGETFNLAKTTYLTVLRSRERRIKIVYKFGTYSFSEMNPRTVSVKEERTGALQDGINVVRSVVSLTALPSIIEQLEGKRIPIEKPIQQR